MKTYDKSFEEAKWIREREDTVIEGRPARIEDFKGSAVVQLPDSTIIDFEDSLGDLQSGWKRSNPKFQDVLDGYLLRRIQIKLQVKKTCSTVTADHVSVAAILTDATLTYCTAGNSTGIQIPITAGNVQEVGGYTQYSIESISIKDRINSISDITLNLNGYGNWILVKMNPDITE